MAIVSVIDVVFPSTPWAMLSSKPSSSTSWGVDQLSWSNVNVDGDDTVATVSSAEDTVSSTSETGCELSSTVNVIVPPSATVTECSSIENGRTVVPSSGSGSDVPDRMYPAASLSVVVTFTSTARPS